MLVLSRKKNESIVVNDAIVITVVEIRGDKVRLGIEAPREVPIHRSEVYAAIQANGQPGVPVVAEDSQASLEVRPSETDGENTADAQAVNGNRAAPR